jgi:hypothetical protein
LDEALEVGRSFEASLSIFHILICHIAVLGRRRELWWFGAAYAEFAQIVLFAAYAEIVQVCRGAEESKEERNLEFQIF